MQMHDLFWQVTPDLLGLLYADGKFVKTNPAWFDVLGHRPEEIESRQFFDFLHPDDVDRTIAAFETIQGGRPVLQFENRYRHADGTYRWRSWNAAPEGDHFFCSARDVTAAKEGEEELRSSAAEARLREQFISILGHDLRNPLAAAACAVEFLDREPLTERGRIVTKTANQSLQRMSALIDDILDFARSRMMGDIGVNARPNTPLTPILEQTASEIRMAHPDIRLVEDYDFVDDATCDAPRIAQVISNILGNAVFHGEPGGSVYLEGRSDAEQITLSVTNQGGTIPGAVKAMLFEPFKRAEPGSSQNGLGLGLYIAKQIAVAHGGDLGVVSADRRTTFTLTLPRGAMAATGTPAPLRAAS